MVPHLLAWKGRGLILLEVMNPELFQAHLLQSQGLWN